MSALAARVYGRWPVTAHGIHPQVMLGTSLCVLQKNLFASSLTRDRLSRPSSHRV